MSGLNLTAGGGAIAEWLRAVQPELRALVNAADRLVDVVYVASIEDPNELPPETQTAAVEPTVAEFLHREIVAVRAELAELRAGLQHEVRTQRLVVIHPDDGRELVYTHRLPDSIGLKVCWHDDDPQFPSVAMMSGCESDDLCDAGLSVIVGGNSAAWIGGVHRNDGHAHGDMTVTSTDADGRHDTAVMVTRDGVEMRGSGMTARARFEVTP
ncbi:MAG: hypothetical protein JWN99_386 [Ilumatobacteraceae bacterium]|nr:hypothetical protein [Ilumatobacteraceae bacterium]